MKTTKFFLLFSLALIFAGMNSVQSNNSLTDIPKGLHSASISYDVLVHFTGGNSLCNVYLVQVTDEKGRLVAPAQRFEPGVTRYKFHEQGPMRGKLRIASLVKVTYPNHFVCVNDDLSTAPAIKEGPFLLGHTYSFDLYPVMIVAKDLGKD